MFKASFTEFEFACAKKIVMLIRTRHTCVAFIHKKTVLSLETSSNINFEFIIIVKKKCKMSPFDKNNVEYKTFDNLPFITIFDNFFLLPNQADLSAHLPFIDQ